MNRDPLEEPMEQAWLEARLKTLPLREPSEALDWRVREAVRGAQGPEAGPIAEQGPGWAVDAQDPGSVAGAATRGADRAHRVGWIAWWGGWWGSGLAAAAAVALAMPLLWLKFVGDPQATVSPDSPTAADAVATREPGKPSSAQRVNDSSTLAKPSPSTAALDHTPSPAQVEHVWTSYRPQGIHRGDGGQPYHALRYHEVRHYQWVDDRGSPSLEWTVPEDELLLLPVPHD